MSCSKKCDNDFDSSTLKKSQRYKNIEKSKNNSDNKSYIKELVPFESI